jgi:hypothetical protein
MALDAQVQQELAWVRAQWPNGGKRGILHLELQNGLPIVFWA